MVKPIRAAGGVLTRPGPDGVAQVALVHRPRHNDWTLPKGKLHRGEHPVTAARREVWEETGVHGRVGLRLPSVAYQVPTRGRLADKVVDYWAMRVSADDGFTPGDETDGLAWLDLTEAMSRVSYERDLVVLAAFAELPPVREPVVLVRHAWAGDPDAWTGPDAERPLDRAGIARAAALAEPLACFAPARLISAGPLRCVQTLQPLADKLGLPITVDRGFDDRADPRAAARRLTELASLPGPTVVCSQGKLIPPALAELTAAPADRFPTPKGAAWVLNVSVAGRVPDEVLGAAESARVLVDPLPDPA